MFARVPGVKWSITVSALPIIDVNLQEIINLDLLSLLFYILTHSRFNIFYNDLLFSTSYFKIRIVINNF